MSNSQSKAWLHNPIPDLLLGCGVLYSLVLVLYSVVGPDIRTMHPSYLLPLLVILLSMPHYGATLIRVYEQRKSRRSYAIFSIHTTILLCIAFVYSLYNHTFGSWMLTIYLTWSPWHYTGQNYGLSIMFLKRRGVEVTKTSKRFLYASFILSYFLVFLLFHTQGVSGDAYEVSQGVMQINFKNLGIPPLIANKLFNVFVWIYGFTFIGTIFLFLRRTTIANFMPTGILMLTQALWFGIPSIVRVFSIQSGIEAFDRSFELREYTLLIALGHAVQYLWVTSYYAKATKGWNGFSHYLGKTMAAGISIWTLPVILFSPDLLGKPSYYTGLSLILASVINIHHFILDGAIWKLRNSKIANILIRSETEEAGDEQKSGSGWMQKAVWTTASCGAVLALFLFWQETFVLKKALMQGEGDKAVVVMDRMAYFGRDNPKKRLQAAMIYRQKKEFRKALKQYERSLKLNPIAKQFGVTAYLYGELGEWEDALRLYQSGLRMYEEGKKSDSIEASLKIGVDHALKELKRL